ncbi:MAG: hypothetical protein NTX86_04605 [Candidatus Dependentiae bacterium]|nr:hypothetical protein [Candidatus Dependentiae bacterium]
MKNNLKKTLLITILMSSLPTFGMNIETRQPQAHEPKKQIEHDDNNSIKELQQLIKSLTLGIQELQKSTFSENETQQFIVAFTISIQNLLASVFPENETSYLLKSEITLLHNLLEKMRLLHQILIEKIAVFAKIDNKQATELSDQYLAYLNDLLNRFDQNLACFMPIKFQSTLEKDIESPQQTKPTISGQATQPATCASQPIKNPCADDLKNSTVQKTFATAATVENYLPKILATLATLGTGIYFFLT